MNANHIAQGSILVNALGNRFRRVRRIRDGVVLWDEVRRSHLRPGMRTALLAQSSPLLTMAAWSMRLATDEERAEVLAELEASP